MKVKLKLRVQRYAVERKRVVRKTIEARDRCVLWHEARGWLCLGWRLVVPRGRSVQYEIDLTRTIFKEA